MLKKTARFSFTILFYSVYQDDIESLLIQLIAVNAERYGLSTEIENLYADYSEIIINIYSEYEIDSFRYLTEILSFCSFVLRMMQYNVSIVQTPEGRPNNIFRVTDCLLHGGNPAK